MVNYDMPTRLKAYVSRVGWSGNSGDERIVVSLIGTKREVRLMESLKLAYGVPVKEIFAAIDVVC